MVAQYLREYGKRMPVGFIGKGVWKTGLVEILGKELMSGVDNWESGWKDLIGAVVSGHPALPSTQKMGTNIRKDIVYIV